MHLFSLVFHLCTLCLQTTVTDLYLSNAIHRCCRLASLMRFKPTNGSPPVNSLLWYVLCMQIQQICVVPKQYSHISKECAWHLTQLTRVTTDLKASEASFSVDIVLLFSLCTHRHWWTLTCRSNLLLYQLHYMAVPFLLMAVQGARTKTVTSLKSIQLKIKCMMLGILTANCHDWEVIKNVSTYVQYFTQISTDSGHIVIIKNI